MAKAKGKEKPTSSTVPEEVEVVTGDDVPAETEPVKMEVQETPLDADKSEEADKPEDAEQPDKEKELNENGTPEAEMNSDTPADEKPEEGDTKEEEGDTKDETKGDESTKKASNKKGKRIRKRKRAAADAGGSTSTADKAVDLEKKGLKPESAGLIFMCNAKTKQECFDNNIFGLPSSKKHLVDKIEKGMTLFLYDFDSKMMHGIYQAAGPGGDNIEPALFGAKFPSQVRFSTVSKCEPLSQEQFKVAIKANYYGRNKFNAQLSKEQVDDLCKLFESDDRSPTEKNVTAAEKSPVAAGRGRRGKAPNSGGGRDRRGKVPDSGGGRGRTGKAPNSAGRDRNVRPSRNFQRGAPYYPRGVSYPARDSYAARYPPVPPPAYPYAAAGDYYYRGEPREPVEYRDPYSSYREPAPYYPDAGYPSSGLYAPPPQYRY